MLFLLRSSFDRNCMKEVMTIKVVMIKHIDDIINFIDNESSDNTKILFHCLAGVNRSVTLCIAYLMNRYKDEQSITDIVDLVSKQRHIGILSNVGFVKQLVQYNSKLYSK